MLISGIYYILDLFFCLVWEKKYAKCPAGEPDRLQCCNFHCQLVLPLMTETGLLVFC